MAERFAVNSSAASACAGASFSCAALRLITDAVLASVSVISYIPVLSIRKDYNRTEKKRSF